MDSREIIYSQEQKAVQILAQFCEWEKHSKPVVRWLEEQQYNYKFTSLRTGNDLFNRLLIQPPTLIRRECN